MIYKAYKIKKSEYSDLPALLNRIGLLTDNVAAPDRCVVSSKTYKVFKRELFKLAKKKYPLVIKRKLLSVVNMELLNLGPCEIDKGVEFGYIITAKESF